MSEDVRVTNMPAERSHYQVAFDLMKENTRLEGRPTTGTAREHFLTLFRQCHQVVYRNHTFAEVTAEKSKTNVGSW